MRLPIAVFRATGDLHAPIAELLQELLAEMLKARIGQLLQFSQQSTFRLVSTSIRQVTQGHVWKTNRACRHLAARSARSCGKVIAACVRQLPDAAGRTIDLTGIHKALANPLDKVAPLAGRRGALEAFFLGLALPPLSSSTCRSGTSISLCFGNATSCPFQPHDPLVAAPLSGMQTV